MKRIKTPKVISLVLAVVLLISSIPLSSLSAFASEDKSFDILLDGQKVSALKLLEDDKLTLTTSFSDSESLSYRWQLLIDEENDEWVGIRGGTKNFCNVTYALIGSLLDSNGTACLRCKIDDGERIYCSNTVAITVSYTAGTTYEAQETQNAVASEAESRAATPMLRAAAAVADDEEYTTCNIIVNYTYADGSIAFEPFTATIEYGGDFSFVATSPEVVGYAPKRQVEGEYINAAEVIFNETDVMQDITINVVYQPVLVNYTVRHHLQNVLNDDYEKDVYVTTGKALTGSQVPDCEMFIDGFSPLFYERLTVAADGSTEIEIFYDRSYYLVYFDLDGGYGVEPIYTRYGATVGANNPTRAGYVFDGWTLTTYDIPTTDKDITIPTEDQKAEFDINVGEQITVPAANLTYKAVWLTSDSSYTVVYWKENADDSGYSYWGSVVKNAISGTVVSGSDDIPSSITTTTVDGASLDERQYFNYNDKKTDKNVIVEGDHSTVVNVYYTRNVYNIYFTGFDGECAIPEHTHGKGCEYKIICGNTHVHDETCGQTLICEQEEHTHTSYEDENGCYNLICDHVHNDDCYAVGQRGSLSATNKPANALTSIGNGIYTYTTESTSWWSTTTTTHYYVQIGEQWYCGANSRGSIDDTLLITLNCEHHDASCYELICGNEEHTHSNYDSCYTYTCGEHVHTEECYGDCTLLEHNHATDDNTNNPVIYVVSAKYEQTIGDVWPTAADFPDETLRGWSIDDISATAVSKRINMTEDLCDTSDRLKYADSVTGGSTRYLYYMFESFDQSSTENGNERILRNGVYYDKSALYYQEVYTSGTFNQKEILGMAPVSNGVVTSESNIFLYYTRNSYTLKFDNHGDVVTDKTKLFLYEADISGAYFVPKYPATLEPNAYYFAGWYTTPECFAGSEFNFENATMPASDLELFAKWAPMQHDVNVYLTADLTEQIGSTQKVAHNSFANAPEGDVANGNYSFAGWFYVDEDGTEKAFLFNSMPITHDIKVYAKWQSKVAVKYEIHYELADGTQIADPVIGSTLAGMNKTFNAKGGEELYSAYQEGYFPNVNSHTQVMEIERENSFTFVYSAVENVPYRVEYRDAETGNMLPINGTDAAGNVIENGLKRVQNNKKAVVTETFVKYTGYMPDAYQKRLVLSSKNDGQNVITFYYTKDEQHAYYRIVHKIQNLSGSDYTEYRSIEAVGNIGETYTGEAISITGYKFAGAKSLVNGVVTPVTGTEVSGTLTADGLLIELFYDRIDVNYTVKYLESGTEKVLHDPETGTGEYGAQLQKTYVTIPGYTLVGEPTRTITLAANEERNVITFYYQEQQISIQYKPVGNGKVSIGSENVKAVSGPVSGSLPTPDTGYKFVGWYSDEACTNLVSADWVAGDHKLVPQQENGLYVGRTYYAKFEADITDLTIKKSYPVGADYSIDEHQTFLFRIQGGGVDLTVTVHGNDQITVSGLKVDGSYTITEITDWSWRYEFTEVETNLTKVESSVTNGATVVLSSDEADNVVTFVNTRSNPYWLDGDSYIVNIFDGNSAQ